MNLEVHLDRVDWQILSELQRNARLSYTELGRRVGLTAPAVAERIRRMEEAEVIEGYRLHLNLARVGYPLQAVIRIAMGTCSDCSDCKLIPVIQRLPEVIECHRLTGLDCFVLVVAVDSPEHLQQLVDRLGHYGKTTTSMVLSSPVTHRIIEPAEDQRELR